MSKDTINSKDDSSVSNVDATLLFLCRMANVEVGVSITIFLKGTTITGNLISGASYCKLTAGKLKAISNSQGENEAADLMAGFFSDLGESHYSTKNGLESIPTNYLHLSDAQMVSGNGQFFKLTDGLLRVKLVEIDGYFLGRISIENQ
ncbi:hypothetical protein LL394_004899 [Serratia marcescens]|uniref:hypothetical protein n=1 Tax=Serratia marcescens TaxID=615 RepID=UPI0011B99986|nr:hypothetical protein [Serratia marcescens]TWY29300.1 hypothetical protein FR965_14215 [Serratia marcescens]HAT3746333.1 hypothetical protein [Serratia marcescens]HAT3786583.1 hypothetical protein [Serratia marcescens]HAT3791708.1 hypothetical protein [Serratia marcescens]HAT3801892.1 hypothetical protein [Serratia marcescens]